MSAPASFDPIWERKYGAGHAQRYPWDVVVSFVFRNAPRDVPRAQVGIVEVGCGTGANLWFAAREGFRVAGVDASESAIAYARERFAHDGLSGDLRVADFTALPFADGGFDLALDRGALVCCGFADAERALAQLHRVLVPGGRLLFNPYSSAHTSARSGSPGPDGLRLGIDRGSLVGAGQLCFYARERVERVLARGWRIVSLEHLEVTRVDGGDGSIHAEWRVVAERV